VDLGHLPLAATIKASPGVGLAVSAQLGVVVVSNHGSGTLTVHGLCAGFPVVATIGSEGSGNLQFSMKTVGDRWTWCGRGVVVVWVAGWLGAPLK
jgi:hypothetical protein